MARGRVLPATSASASRWERPGGDAARRGAYRPQVRERAGLHRRGAPRRAPWRLKPGVGRRAGSYLGALGLVVAAVGAAIWLGPEWVTPSTLLVLVVVLCGVRGGLGPALLAAAWGFAALNYQVEEPAQALTVSDPRTFLNGALFVTAAFIASALQLAGVEAFVEIQGGRVHRISPDGAGTTITVRLPRRRILPTAGRGHR